MLKHGSAGHSRHAIPGVTCRSALWPIILVVVASLNSSPPARAEILFESPYLSFDTGTEPRGAAAADVNADGKPDLVVANSGDNTVSVLLGNGDGTFGTRNDYATASYPVAVSMADFDADGSLDLAVANHYSNTVSVLLGGGDGTFRTGADYPTGSSPTSVAARDLNADGRPDLAVVNETSNTVSILLGNEGGTFGTRTDYGTGTRPVSVVVGDWNGDGSADVAVANRYGNTISVLTGGGDGTFGTRNDFPTGDHPGSVATGDFNRDGSPDLAAANESNGISVLLGNGDGTFGMYVDYDTENGPSSLAVGDFNRDGVADLVTATMPDYGDGRASVLPGNGDGTFGECANFKTGSLPTHAVIGDFDGDSDMDLVTTHSAHNSLSVLLGNGDGTFGSGREFDVGDAPLSVGLGDFDGNGAPDLVTANCSDSSVSVLLGRGDGTFGTKIDHETDPVPCSQATADLDGNGKLDLVTANREDGTVTVLLGSGDGSFWSRNNYRTEGGATSVAIRDLNGDHKPDFVVTNYASNTVSVFLAYAYGTFDPAGRYDTENGPSAVAIGDLDRDGKPDLIVACIGSYPDYNGVVSVLLGNGDGSFGEKNDYPTGSDPASVAIGDLDRDGDADVAVANCFSHTVSVLLGNGDGTLAIRNDFTAGWYPACVAIGDLDGDWNPDLAVANGGRVEEAPATISVLLGDGHGSFGSKVDYGTGDNHVAAVAIGDLNRDGKPDLAAANTASDAVSALLNVGTGVACPGPFMLLAPENGANLDPSEPQTLQWESAWISSCTGAVRYTAYWSLDPDFSEADSADAGTATSWEIPSGTLLLDTTYYWHVKARDMDGHMHESDPPLGFAFGTHATPVLLAPRAAVSEQGITVTWTVHDGTGPLGFKLYRRDRGSEWACLAADLPSCEETCSYVDREVEPGVRYEYEVEAYGPAGITGRFGPVSVEATAPAALGLRLAPNPSTGMLSATLALPRGGDMLFRVYDTQGREVARNLLAGLRAGVRQVHWDVRDAAGRLLSAGSYYVRLETPAGRRTARWLVIR